MKIQITQEHINRGKYSFCTGCPVALALRDAGFKNPVVWSLWVEIRGRRRNLSQEAIKFIRDFDSHRPVQPIKLELYEDE